jgi:hypothetical protein
MKQMTAESVQTPLEGGSCQDVMNPFRHLLFVDIFAPAALRGLREWLESEVTWKYCRNHFSARYGVDLLSYADADEFRPFVANVTLSKLRAILEKHFAVRLDSAVSIFANRLDDGQGIGVHNDNTAGEFRLVVLMTEQWQPSAGGILLLLQDPSTRGGLTAYPPSFNRCIAFETNARSLHAVSEVSGASQISLVYVFRMRPGGVT